MSDTEVPAPTTQRPHQYDTVQVLRFVAALMVVITHSTLYASDRLGRGNLLWTDGSRGVDLFFVISGWVMVLSSRKLIGKPDGWKDFAVQRLVRICPLYWLATTVKLVLMLYSAKLAYHSQLDWWAVVKSYLFIPSINIDGEIKPLLAVGWTLIFEMFFYLVLTIGLALRINLYAWAGAVFACVLVLAQVRPAHASAAWFLADPIVLEFLFGMGVGWLTLASVRLPRALAAVCLVGGLLLTYAWPRPLDLVSYNLSGGMMDALIVWSAVSLEPVLRGRIPRSLIFLGAASYAIYLFHPLCAPAMPAILHALKWPVPVVSILGSVVTALIVGAIVARYVEVPLTRLVRRVPGLRLHTHTSVVQREVAGLPA